MNNIMTNLDAKLLGLITRSGSVELIDAELYNVGDKEYLYTKDDNLYLYARNLRKINGEEGKSVKTLIQRRKNRLHLIREERQRIARKLSGLDAVLEEILLMHMDWNNGKIGQNVISDQIVFYQVGEDTANEFFVGTKEGKRYIRVYWPEVKEEDIYEVERFEGKYLGK